MVQFFKIDFYSTNNGKFCIYTAVTVIRYGAQPYLLTYPTSFPRLFKFLCFTDSECHLSPSLPNAFSVKSSHSLFIFYSHSHSLVYYFHLLSIEARAATATILQSTYYGFRFPETTENLKKKLLMVVGTGILEIVLIDPGSLIYHISPNHAAAYYRKKSLFYISSLTT